jgi:enamine deaminase RidA (YjgF/YER057c/UK114 family)
LADAKEKEQARQAFKNIKAVIQLMISVADKGSGKPLMEEFNDIFEAKKEVFPKATPSGTGVRIKDLAFPDLLLEIQAVVAL